jgi:hypothetical protein
MPKSISKTEKLYKIVDSFLCILLRIRPRNVDDRKTGVFGRRKNAKSDSDAIGNGKYEKIQPDRINIPPEGANTPGLVSRGHSL